MRGDKVQVRALAFLLCIPSGGVLLAHIYGFLPMGVGGWLIALPSCVALAALYWFGDKKISEAIAVGVFAGLVGTILYDVARVPVLMAGRRVFGPIELYGVWLLDAEVSSRFTFITGWLYHLSNGITFGIMYALFMRGRHWLWAVAWAFVLETIFIVSPLAYSVALFKDSWAVVAAYYGHVAYGIGLGWLVQRWDYSSAQLKLLEPAHKWILAGVPVLVCALYLWNGPVEQDRRARPGILRVEGTRLNPDWVRLTDGGRVTIENPGTVDVIVRMPQSNVTLEVKAGQSAEHTFAPPEGVFSISQVFVTGPARTHSSFVIVDRKD